MTIGAKKLRLLVTDKISFIQVWAESLYGVAPEDTGKKETIKWVWTALR